MVENIKMEKQFHASVQVWDRCNTNIGWKSIKQNRSLHGGSKSVYASNLWFLDTDATHHLTHNKNFLHNYKTPPWALEVQFEDNGTKVAIGKGECTFHQSNKVDEYPRYNEKFIIN